MLFNFDTLSGNLKHTMQCDRLTEVRDVVARNLLRIVHASSLIGGVSKRSE